MNQVILVGRLGEIGFLVVDSRQLLTPPRRDPRWNGKSRCCACAR
jgi:hypothetical protein